MTVASTDIKRLTNAASMRVNKLILNPQKTEFILIGHPRTIKQASLPESLVLNNESKKRVTQTKSLGLIVGENLSWEGQFNRTMGRMYSGIRALKRLKNILPQSQLCIFSLRLSISKLAAQRIQTQTGCPEIPNMGSFSTQERRKY